ncbi:unnamed protein product [Trichobilharzia regenti]|nr:unnamed protein product [Trichobilharzia regenti]
MELLFYFIIFVFFFINSTVASKIGSPPKSSVLTSQHIRFLAHAEAAAIADSKSETYRPDTSDNRSASGEQQATTGDQQQQQQQQQQASVSPDEWFIFAQSSILSCLLERPYIQCPFHE